MTIKIILDTENIFKTILGGAGLNYWVAQQQFFPRRHQNLALVISSCISCSWSGWSCISQLQFLAGQNFFGGGEVQRGQWGVKVWFGMIKFFCQI